MAARGRAVGGRLPAPTTVSTIHSHNIAVALANARVADLHRAATHTTATAPPRRHRRTLAVLGLTGALARPIEDAATPASAHFEGAREVDQLRAASSLGSGPWS